METGDTFNNEGSSWIAQHVTVEENARFRWLNVLAKWSGFGLRPLWATEPKRFLIGRQRK